MKIRLGHCFSVICLLGMIGCTHSDKAALNAKDLNKTDSISSAAKDADSTTVLQAGLPTSREDCKKLDGNIFRYKGADDLPDSIRHTIIFRCENDSLKGLMFGPDPEGEHGMFYFRTNLENLQVNGSLINFNLAMGHLYHKPYTLNNYKAVEYEVQGGSNGMQIYKGKLAGDSIVFTCDSDGDCYDRVMVFKKIER